MSASYESVVKWLAASEKRIRELEEGIRKHEAHYYTGDPNDLCFENDFELYLLLPENNGKKVEDFLVLKPEMPTEEQWLTKCKSYYCSRKELK